MTALTAIARLRRPRLALLLAALLFGGACGGAEGQRPGPRSGVLASGRPLSLTLPRLGGGTLSLEELRGQRVLLTIFATWDLRSQAEAPLMQQLHARRGERDLAVVGVYLGPLGAKGLPLVRTFVEVMGITYPVLLAEPTNPELVGALGTTRQVPRTLLLDPQGRVELEMVGQTDFPRLRALLAREAK